MIIGIKITSFTNVEDFVYDYINYDLHSREGSEIILALCPLYVRLYCSTFRQI
jgi:hypothetical protein